MAERQRSETRAVQPPSPRGGRDELHSALEACRKALLGVFLFSGVINVLALTGAFFMMQVYDRVLPSRSVPTLLALILLAGVLFCFLGFLDFVRGRLLVRIGTFLDQSVSERVFAALIKYTLRSPKTGDGLQPLRDLDQFRSFAGGPGPSAMFDLPWLIVYVIICFMFHWAIGVTVLLGAAVLFGIAAISEIKLRQPTKTLSAQASDRLRIAELGRRNVEALHAMGMTDRLAKLWLQANTKYVSTNSDAADLSGATGAVSRTFRMAFQSLILAMGAWLVIHQEASSGVMIASAILSAKALAPLELTIASWRGFIGARQSWVRLEQLLKTFPEPRAQIQLSPPSANLSVEQVTAFPPGSQRAVLQDISFVLQRGHGLGIIGPSASGKSSLARVITGVWAAARGHVRLDGASLEQWPAHSLGRHIGYLPQDVELLAGTVAQNICRLDPDPNESQIIAAAKAAGVHELILQLPGGYDMQIGEGGNSLSAGQTQRIALARALYGDPFLVVLDEPNSNLDSLGDEALTRAILGVRARGGIVVVVAHRPSAIEGVDLLLAMSNGRAPLPVGPKDEILNKISRPVAVNTAIKEAGRRE